MSRLSRFFGKHTLGAAVLMVAVPLAVLLVMQSIWLVRLERATEIARKEALDNFLEGITSGIERYYRATAEKALSARADMFLEGRFTQLERRWKETPPKGARLLFVVDYTEMEFGTVRVFEPKKGRLVEATASEDILAVIMASVPYQMARTRGTKIPITDLATDERDPDRRLVLNPVTDGNQFILGVVGMILESDFLRTAVIPKYISQSTARFSGWVEPSDLEIFIDSTRNDPETGEKKPPQGQVSAHLNWVFTDIEVHVRIRGLSGERWAKAGLAVNSALSIFLIAATVGGVWFALRAADRSMRLSQMKSDFVSNVSHELRTPLASIRAFAELMRLGRVADPGKVREYGDIIEAETRRLSRLIENILDFSRIESGRKTYEFAAADLVALVETTVQAFERRMPDGDFQFEWAPPGKPLPLLRLDAGAIGQAVSNVLDNAVKYSGESRKVVIGVRQEGDEGVVFVKDSGIGIPPAEVQRIFERFHRVGSALVHDVKGSGLGLSIVHHIVQAHGGRVTVDSVPGEGSTFSIWLPLNPKQGPEG